MVTIEPVPEAPKTALVVCYSYLKSDPRVTRQIDWLSSAGWIVDTVGLGPDPRPTVRQHFELLPYRGLRKFRAVRLFAHVFLPYSLRFRALEGSQVRRVVKTNGNARYGLVLVNDIDLLPWVADTARELLSTKPQGLCHLDVHEYHKWETQGVSRTMKWLFAGYHKWLVSFIGSHVFTSRSTVADGIADLYAADFGIPRPSIVRNSPAFVDQQPSAVDAERIELVYHGNADLARGLHLLVEAMSDLDDRFVLNLMLTGTAEGKASLSSMTQSLGSRVRFIEAVPMAEVSSAINDFDLEVIFYPPTGPNYLFSFPNKFFEAVQGRLGIVIGQSPSMVEVVTKYDNGVVVDGWESSDLARTLNSLTADRIRAMKNRSNICAETLNSQQEGVEFLKSIGADPH